MKIREFLFLMPAIVAAVAMTGCDKEETISASGDKAPVFAPEYIGQMKVTRDIIGFPTSRTDSVVLRIKGTSYDLYITGGRRTSLCDSHGIFTYSTESKVVYLGPERIDPDLCDSLRVPQGSFNATVTTSSLNFDGHYVVPLTTDTVWFEFRLIAAPPR